MSPEMERSGLLVHEWLERTGGSENVFESIAASFPRAAIAAAWNNAPDRFPEVRVSETWLARTPLRRSKPLSALALTMAWRSRAIAGDARWALISTHLFAHHLKVPDQIPKLLYVHTPARYIWSPELDPRGTGRIARALAPPLKLLDRNRAREATSIAANSAYVRDRIRRHWGLQAEVLHPPVSVERVRASVGEGAWKTAPDAHLIEGLPSEFLLGVSRFVSYKRLDSVIAAGEATGMPVVLAGAGSDEAALRKSALAASVPVHFVIQPSSPVLYEIYRRANVLVFPAVEDFGIVPVEAMAVGTPVVGVRSGGLLETVQNGRSGFLIDDFSGPELRGAIRGALSLNHQDIRDHSDRFSEEVFRSRLLDWVDSHVPQASVLV